MLLQDRWLLAVGGQAHLSCIKAFGGRKALSINPFFHSFETDSLYEN